MLADKSTKKGPLYHVKWMGINNQGCTWEPTAHLIGEIAEKILSDYLAKKEADRAAADQRRADIMAGNLVETGPTTTPSTEVIDMTASKDNKKTAVFLGNKSRHKEISLLEFLPRGKR